MPLIELSKIKIFCGRNFVKDLSTFGSFARSEVPEMSDIDVLVDFRTNVPDWYI